MTLGSRANLSARSVPNDQPITQSFSTPSSLKENSIAASTSNFSVTPSPKLPSLVPASDVVPLLLNLMISIPAIAGNLFEAFL